MDKMAIVVSESPDYSASSIGKVWVTKYSDGTFQKWIPFYNRRALGPAFIDNYPPREKEWTEWLDTI